MTALILEEKGLTLDEKTFQEELDKQKNRSRAAAQMDTEDWTILIEDAPNAFVGYDQLQADVKITRYRKVSSKKDGDLYQIAFDTTPFYPEGGGQVGDLGFFGNDSEKISIVDTKKENNLILHFTKKIPSNPKATFQAVVNAENRNLTNSNHSATHLLHQALRSSTGNSRRTKRIFGKRKKLTF